MLTILFWWMGCNGCWASPTAVAPSEPPPPPALQAPSLQARPLAPSKAVWGLTLGASSAAEIEAKLASLQLSCPASPSLRRMTVRYDCGSGLTPAILPDRTIQGALSGLLLVRQEAGPLTHLSTQRRYSVPRDAATDYTAAIAAITAQLGPPTRSQAVDPAKLNAPLVRYSAAWQFQDVEVQLTMMKMGAPYFTVDEQWDVPGAEQGEATRASTRPPQEGGSGGAAHPAGEKPWWHP